ncbi:hypothetical protein OsccyDRAFT_2716 [Leptolyngbyaceae cyanobacterium JSC-12]|nr:hypothetical protein OsccyDRAFT_2716 [Leptolyngbyaceae cyanobacterium JSC-12]
MIAYISPLNTITIAQVVKRILKSGKITRADETFFLRAMVAEDPLTTEEMQQVHDLFNRLRMGLLKVVD